MNTPNRLTILRIFLVPIFMLVLLWDFPFHYFCALAVFSIASLTDMFDGQIARRRNLITDFGKFLDPIADKMLTTAAFLGFITLGNGVGMVWITLVVLIREFTVSSIRMIAAASGKVVAADIWGKAKTVCQMIGIILTLLFEGLIELFSVCFPTFTLLNTPLRVFYNVVLWGSAALTVVSGINYIIKNKAFIDPKK